MKRVLGLLVVAALGATAEPALAKPGPAPSAAAKDAAAKDAAAKDAATKDAATKDAAAKDAATPAGSDAAGEGAAAPAAPAAPVTAPADTEQRMDDGLERLAGKDYEGAATAFYGVYRALPETDLRRDTASFHLATALVELGLTQAGVEHYIEVLVGRRVPELLNKTLSSLKPLYEQHKVDEGRFVESVLYGSSYSELAPDVGDFVEYLQALTDMKRGFRDWGRGRLETLSRAKRAYSFHARYALGVDRLARRDDETAAKDFRAIIAASEAPNDIKNDARIALARILYEKKSYDEAWKVYSRVDVALPFKDVVMLEQAWDRVASGDEQRALGVLVGLGAPVFRHLFSPERDLIKAMALRRLCQYRAAHVAVREFRASYGPVLQKIRDRAPLGDDPTMREWASRGTRLLSEQARMRSILAREKNEAASVGDKALIEHLDAVYTAGITRTDTAINRGMLRALDQVSDELLRVDEQMSLITYEIGAGLFKSGGDTANSVTANALRPEDVPKGSPSVFFRFDGEYWSDEIGDYTVLSQNRCVR